MEDIVVILGLKAFKGTIETQAFQSLHEGSVEITLTAVTLIRQG